MNMTRHEIKRKLSHSKETFILRLTPLKLSKSSRVNKFSLSKIVHVTEVDHISPSMDVGRIRLRGGCQKNRSRDVNWQLVLCEEHAVSSIFVVERTQEATHNVAGKTGKGLHATHEDLYAGNRSNERTAKAGD